VMRPALAPASHHCFIRRRLYFASPSRRIAAKFRQRRASRADLRMTGHHFHSAGPIVKLTGRVVPVNVCRVCLAIAEVQTLTGF
jgi:hypothetical protein